MDQGQRLRLSDAERETVQAISRSLQAAGHKAVTVIYEALNDDKASNAARAKIAFGVLDRIASYRTLVGLEAEVGALRQVIGGKPHTGAVVVAPRAGAHPGSWRPYWTNTLGSGWHPSTGTDSP